MSFMSLTIVKIPGFLVGIRLFFFVPAKIQDKVEVYIEIRRRLSLD